MEAHPRKGSTLGAGNNFATLLLFSAQSQHQSVHILWRVSSKVDSGHLVHLNDSIVREAPKNTRCPLSDSQSWQVMADQRGGGGCALVAEQLLPFWDSTTDQVLRSEDNSDKSRKRLSSRFYFYNKFSSYEGKRDKMFQKLVSNVHRRL